jgi:hypothetical protein
MRKKRKRLRRFCALAALLSIYPFCVLSFIYSHVLSSDFEGGRNGKLDAYRHVLSSAIVSYTLGEWAVELVTSIFERDDKDSNKMDRHNNKIGASIGSKIESFWEIEPTVQKSVLNGGVGATDLDQITWLPATKWRDGKLW